MGAEPVVVLYASISVLNWMRAATGSQCKETKRVLYTEREDQGSYTFLPTNFHDFSMTFVTISMT